jgi:hypothetical protein
VTTPEPGARTVLLYGLTFKPFSTAFLAIKPAATKESGLEVLVQEVIADTTIDPFLSSCSYPSILNL